MYILKSSTIFLEDRQNRMSFNGPREISEALSHDTLVDWLFCHLEKLSKDEISQQLEIKHLEEREVKGEILPPSIVAEGPAFNVIWEKQV